MKHADEYIQPLNYAHIIRYHMFYFFSREKDK
jgi:hypothetical protein